MNSLLLLVQHLPLHFQELVSPAGKVLLQVLDLLPPPGSGSLLSGNSQVFNWTLVWGWSTVAFLPVLLWSFESCFTWRDLLKLENYINELGLEAGLELDSEGHHSFPGKGRWLFWSVVEKKRNMIALGRELRQDSPLLFGCRRTTSSPRLHLRLNLHSAEVTCTYCQH